MTVRAPASVVRIGILGAARIGPKAVILPALGRSDVEVCCVAARDPVRAAAYAAEHGIAAVAASYEALVARDDIDLVYVALPPASHAHWSIEALNQGKAVLCEKPFALSSAEAAEMVAAAQRAGRPLIEAFHYRHHPLMHRLVELMRSGALGQLKTVHAQFEGAMPYAPNELRWSAEQGGGALMDFGCYPLHFVRSLLGEEPTVREAGRALRHGVDSATQAVLAFPSGVVASIGCSMVAPALDASAELVGERGRVFVSNFILPHYGAHLDLLIDGVRTRETFSAPTTYEAQLAHVIDVLHGRAAPLTGGSDSVANMSLIEAIGAAAAEGRRAGTRPGRAF